MATIYAADPNQLIEETAKELKKIKEIEPPEWAGYVKTGHFKQRPPVDKDWWYMRAAAILRKVYKLGPIGTSKLRGKFGGKKNRGVRPEHTYKGSGSIIRKCLQQLEKAELIQKVEKGVHRGRIIAPKGRSLLDKISTKIYIEDKKSRPRPIVEKKVEQAEKKEDIKEVKEKDEKKPKQESQKEVNKEKPETENKKKEEQKAEYKEKDVKKKEEEKKEPDLKESK